MHEAPDNGPAVPPAPRRGVTRGAEGIVVFLSQREGKCAECGADFARGQMIRVEDGQPLCRECADLGHLEFLPSGNTALTRRASKHSPLRAVVVQWSRRRRRYERQGVLVTADSIARAEAECLDDAALREHERARAAERREGAEAAYVASVVQAMRAAFPGCPPAEAGRIAAWACAKHSGRVGRSAAAKALDATALKLAVVAHIRHEHTGYDRLLMAHGDRAAARQSVRPEIDRVLARWETPPGNSGGGDQR